MEAVDALNPLVSLSLSLSLSSYQALSITVNGEFLYPLASSLKSASVLTIRFPLSLSLWQTFGQSDHSFWLTLGQLFEAFYFD